MIKHGFPKYLECSSKGDSRFSALHARVKARGNETIENIYQSAKVFEDGSTNLSFREAKGRRAVNQNEVAALYKALWREYMQENPHLLPIITAAAGLSDMFGQSGSACQATELWQIRVEAMLLDLKCGGNIRVTNKRRGSPNAPDHNEVIHDVDRSNKVLGNPFFLSDVNNRIERYRVINDYREHLAADRSINGPMWQEIQMIADKLLRGEEVCLNCWCAPLPCHGDVIRDAVIDVAWRKKMNIEPQPVAIAQKSLQRRLF